MTQQQISTPSIIDIEDSKILSSHAQVSLGIPIRDPWTSVLTQLETRSLDPSSVVAGMDSALLPSTSNPFVTRSLLDLRMTSRGLILIGPVGSNADFEGLTDSVFTSAISSLPSTGGRIAVLSSTYVFSSCVTIPDNIIVTGIHPLSVIIQGSGDYPCFDLNGSRSSLEYVTLENSHALTSPVVRLSGERSSLLGCRVQTVPLLAVQMTGSKAFMNSCLVISDSSGIWFQGIYQSVYNCSFSGLMTSSALRFESSQCCALASFIHTSVVGPSYLILSPTCTNNKLVGNHLGTLTAVSASIDQGTASVRYANTPDTPLANENNFLIALQSYTGQPDLNSTEMVLSNHFAHDVATDTDATSILSSLDLFTQRIYEERSWFLTSDDPMFDSVGVPTSGVFVWSGTTFSWPDFTVRSIVPSLTWTVSSNSTLLNPGQCLVCNINRTSSGSVTPIVMPLSLILANPSDANRLVLAFSPATGMLVWTQGFKIFINLTTLFIDTNQIQVIPTNIQMIINSSSGSMTFDVDGMFLPINRFIGIPGDPRNAQPIPTSFAVGSDMATKLGSQSDLLSLMYEKTNLWEYSDNSIDTFPTAGSWLDLTSNRPGETPSHLIQVKGTTYVLFPNFGLYRWYRSQPSDMPGIFGLLVGCPVVGPFASLSLIGTTLAVLTCAGTIVTWDTDLLVWTTISPTTSLSLPLPSVRPVGYDSAGQTDFIFQSPDYSLFTLLDGRSILYFQSLNSLVEIPRVFTETPRGRQLLGRHLKDTGFNIARNHWIDTTSNGTFSNLQGLPLSGTVSPAIEIPPEVWSSSLASVKWDSLQQESFSFDPNSGSFLDVAFSGSTYYVLAGGYGWSRLLSVVTIGMTTGFTDFSPHGWLTDTGNGEVIAFGTTVSTSAFTVVQGKATSSSVLGSPAFTWTKTVLGTANSCKGSIGVLERWNGQGSGNAHILVSDLARFSRPTWWTFSRSSSTWSSVTLSESGGGGSAIIPQAVANSFIYNVPTDRQAGFGVYSTSGGVRFLIRDAARSGRPTLLSYNGTSFTGIRLSEGPLPTDVTVVGADVNSATQFYGAMYQQAFDAFIWSSRDSTGNQIRLFFYFVTANLWSVMPVGLGAATYLNTLALGTPTFTHRTGTLLTEGLPTGFVTTAATANLFIWTQSAGLLKASISAQYLTGISSAVWTQFDKRIPAVSLPIFSSHPVPTTYSPTLGVSRCDISVQIGSLAEKSLPIFSAGLSSTIGSLQWFDTGTKVKQLTTAIWSGLNRNGYLWIGNPSFSTVQQELTPNPSTIRGDITVTNLGYTDDYDFAFNGSQSQIAFVYKDISNANRLAFILYDLATNTVTLERGGASGVVQLGSTPQISYNPVNNSWSIVAQDATIPTSSAKMMFFRRSAISSTWIEESCLASGSGKNPAKPIHHTDGSVLVVTESGASFNGLLSMRSSVTNTWTSIYQTTGGGFKSPKFTKTLDGSMFWIFGGVDSSAKVAWSTNLLSGWSLWSGSQTLASVGYGRITTPTLLPLTSSIVVSSAGSVDGSVPASRELMIWRFDNTGSVACIGGFTSKGRLQPAVYSGEEEDGITDLSWTLDQGLLYGATRPTRSSLHWTIRYSNQSWSLCPHGDSLLGSGRCLTLGDRHFREQWCSAASTGDGTNLIIEYPYSASASNWMSWSSLPLAQRTGETDFTGIKWPFLTSSGYLFTKGSPSSGFSDDTGLSSGSLTTSASRNWPLILGNTRWSGLHHTGPSVLSQGSMLGLFCPVSSTTSVYFGVSSVGSNGLFKIKALAVLTFNGTHTWSVSPTKQYTLIGPVSYQIDTTLPALGSHFVLDFNVPGSLVLDPTSGLSYWTNMNHSLTDYAVVVGEITSEAVLLYPSIGSRKASQFLQFGHIEPIEMSSDIKEWTYSLPYRLDTSPSWQIVNKGSVTNTVPVSSNTVVNLTAQTYHFNSPSNGVLSYLAGNYGCGGGYYGGTTLYLVASYPTAPNHYFFASYSTVTNSFTQISAGYPAWAAWSPFDGTSSIQQVLGSTTGSPSALQPTYIWGWTSGSIPTLTSFDGVTWNTNNIYPTNFTIKSAYYINTPYLATTLGTLIALGTDGHLYTYTTPTSGLSTALPSAWTQLPVATFSPLGNQCFIVGDATTAYIYSNNPSGPDGFSGFLWSVNLSTYTVTVERSIYSNPSLSTIALTYSNGLLYGTTSTPSYYGTVYVYTPVVKTWTIVASTIFNYDSFYANVTLCSVPNTNFLLTAFQSSSVSGGFAFATLSGSVTITSNTSTILISTKLALQETGSLRGLQSTTFTASTTKQLIQRRLLPMNGCFLSLLNANLSSSSRLDSIATMLPSSIMVFDKASGGITT